MSVDVEDAERDERPARYTEGDDVIYRASSLGGCPRALMLTGMGMPGAPWSEWFQKVLDEGTRMEAQIAKMYEKETGHPAVDQQREYDLELIAGVKVRVHIDGRYPYKITTGDGPGMFFEYKKIRPSGWQEFKRRGVEMHDHWIWQMAAIQWATGAELVRMVGGLYNEANDCIDDVYAHNYSNPVLPLKALRKKVLGIETALASGVDPMTVKCEPKMYPCPYYANWHDEKGEGEGAIALDDARDVAKVRLWVSELRALDAEAAALKPKVDAVEKQKAEVKAKVFAWLKEQGKEGAEEESWKYTLDGKDALSVVYTKAHTQQRKASRSLRLRKDQGD